MTRQEELLLRSFQLDLHLRPGRVTDRVYSNLPATLRNITCHLKSDHERDIVLTGALSVVAGALHKARFHYGGMWNSLNLYTAVIAPAARGKGKMRNARKMGEKVNSRLHECSEERLRQWKDRKKSEEQVGPKPTWQRFFLPADSSAASLKKALASSPSGVIFETEFKTLSNVLEQDWGQFRDVLLKGFQNEPVEIGREKLEKPRMIDHPAPSMAVSGTPGTFSEVIADTEDGLFSRFAFYQFEGEASWKSQFGGVETSELDKAVGSAGNRLMEMYQEQEKREEPLYLTFTDQAQEALNRAFSFLTDHWKKEGVRPELHSSLRRAAVRAARIASIMRLLRYHEQGNSLKAPKTVEVGMLDMEVGLRLALTYLVHALQIAEEFGIKDERQSLNREQLRFFEALPDGEFSTADAKKIAKELGTNKRTAQRWISDWEEETNLIEDLSRGNWKKVASGRDSERVPGVISVISVISVIFDTESSPNGEASDACGDGVSYKRAGVDTVELS